LIIFTPSITLSYLSLPFPLPQDDSFNGGTESNPVQSQIKLLRDVTKGNIELKDYLVCFNILRQKPQNPMGDLGDTYTEQYTNDEVRQLLISEEIVKKGNVITVHYLVQL
jgi:hypothetical protein